MVVRRSRQLCNPPDQRRQGRRRGRKPNSQKSELPRPSLFQQLDSIRGLHLLTSPHVLPPALHPTPSLDRDRGCHRGRLRGDDLLRRGTNMAPETQMFPADSRGGELSTLSGQTREFAHSLSRAPPSICHKSCSVLLTNETRQLSGRWT